MVGSAVRYCISAPTTGSALTNTEIGLTALLLSVMGIYGAINYSVVQRTQEFGVRTALGARAVDIIRIVLTQTLRLVLVGSAIGLLGSLALARVLARFLYGVERAEPWIAGGILVSLGTVALAAARFRPRRLLASTPSSLCVTSSALPSAGIPRLVFGGRVLFEGC
jgi:ABC-type antimicrobial peptide transport system permease subunit